MKRVLLSLCTLTVAMGLALSAQAAPNAKCAAIAKRFAAAKAALGGTTAALKACKDKFKRTHLLRCRKQRAARKAAAERFTRIARFHRYCSKGCKGLAKRVAGIAKAHGAALKVLLACKAKHKRTHLLRCRKEHKAVKNLRNALKTASRRLQVCRGGCKFLVKRAAAAAAAYKACRKKNKWTGRVRCLKLGNAAKAAKKRAKACIRFK
ncbi:MAG: hypothetical protein EP343_19550 [Deltaproteobacteria bacterium]|nr:MAG: hypothetical protein EP343_19550 [Deltaproteobacteria bacterium]